MVVSFNLIFVEQELIRNLSCSVQADVASVHEALIVAMDVMAGIQENVTNLLAPVTSSSSFPN